jgi:hypothetical protein
MQFTTPLKSFWRRFRIPLLAALFLRIGSSAWLALVWGLADRYFPLAGKNLQETYNQLTPQSSLVGRMLRDAWLRWDAVHYMNLAFGGYQSAGLGDTNWWPLYPYTTRFIHLFTRLDVVFAGLLVVTFSTAVLFCLIQALVEDSYADVELAKWTVLVYAAFPSAFFLAAPFSESLFCTMAAGCLLLVLRRRWLMAGLLACLAGLTRSQGILLLVPLVTGILLEWREQRRWPRLGAFIAVFIAPAGMVAYVIWRALRGSGSVLESYAVFSRQYMLFPLQSFWLALNQLFTQPDWLQVSELVMLLGFLTVFVWMVAQPRFRKPLPWVLYTGMVLLLLFSKHNEGVSPYQSANRYMLTMQFVFVGLGALLLRLPVRWRGRMLAISTGLGMVLLAMYGLWIFVG